MGQAKRRGTWEQRKAHPNPKPSPYHLTPEDHAKIVEVMRDTITQIKRQLFGKSKPSRPKQPRPRTGG